MSSVEAMLCRASNIFTMEYDMCMFYISVFENVLSILCIVMEIQGDLPTNPANFAFVIFLCGFSCGCY